MLLPKEHLTVEEDGPNSVIEYVMLKSNPESFSANRNPSVVFVQNSGGYDCESSQYQSLTEWPLSPPRSFTPLKARIMKFKFQFDLGSSKYISRAAQQMHSDLHKARKTV